MAPSVAIIINNYLHDVATATLLSSAVILYILWRSAERRGASAVRELAAVYGSLTRIAQIALVWIVLGGIPRIIFFTRFEWDPAVVRGIVVALVVKHVLMTAAVVGGALMWLRIGRAVSAFDGDAVAA